MARTVPPSFVEIVPKLRVGYLTPDQFLDHLTVIKSGVRNFYCDAGTWRYGNIVWNLWHFPHKCGNPYLEAQICRIFEHQRSTITNQFRLQIMFSHRNAVVHYILILAMSPSIKPAFEHGRSF